MKKITVEWVKENAEYYGFDGYGFAIYKYHDLYITIDESYGEILAVEYKECLKKNEGV